MSDLQFRNVVFDRTAPISDWPAEAIETVLDRGTLVDWRALAAEIRRSPWGRAARITDEAIREDAHGSIDVLFDAALQAARTSVALDARRAEATRLRRLRMQTGLSLRAFAALAGTSASRLSDYENAKVAPTTDAIGRLEHAASLSCSESARS